MADVVDRANDLERKYREMMFKDHVSRAGKMVSLTRCELCGEPISQARREAIPGCRLCIDCAEDRDRF